MTLAQKLHQEQNPRQAYETLLRFHEPIHRGSKHYAWLLPDLSRIDATIEGGSIRYEPLVQTVTVNPWPYADRKPETFDEKSERLRAVMLERMKKDVACAGDLIEVTGLSRSAVFQFMKSLFTTEQIVRVEAIAGARKGAVYYKWKEV